MYVDSLACVGVKEGESERFRIDNGVKQGFIMSHWLLNIYIDGVMKEVKMGMGRMGVRLLGDGREWRLPGLLYVDVLVLWGESKGDLRPMVGRLLRVYEKRTESQCK